MADMTATPGIPLRELAPWDEAPAASARRPATGSTENPLGRYMRGDGHRAFRKGR